MKKPPHPHFTFTLSLSSSHMATSVISLLPCISSSSSFTSSAFPPKRPLSFPSVKTTPLPLKLLSSRDSRAEVVTKDSWEKSILKSDVPVLVEFYASWCGPCQMVHRVIDEIARDYEGKLKCYVLNADSDLEVAEEYEIKAVPIVLLFKNGEKRESVVGTMPKEFYVSAIERVLQL